MNNKFDFTPHRVSGSFDPSKFSVIQSFDHSVIKDFGEDWGGECIDPLDPSVVDALAEQGLDAEHCVHCGHRIVRGVAFQHENGDTVIFGMDCADRCNIATRDEFEAARRARQIQNASLRVAFRNNPELSEVLDTLKSVIEDGSNEWAVNVARDLMGTMVKWRKLSEKQIAFARRLPAIVAERKIADAERAAEKANTPAIEAGRSPFEGKVVSVKERDTDFGIVLKATVKNDLGQCVWVTVPGAADVPERGDRVSFVVTISPSDSDPTFGFGKRPSKWVAVS